MSIAGSVGQILFSRYTPLAGTALLLWDHCLTFDEEVATMWVSFKGPILPKVIYVMNRYFAEAVLLYATYVFTGLRRPTANKVSPWHFRDNLTLISELELCIRLLVTLHVRDVVCWHIAMLVARFHRTSIYGLTSYAVLIMLRVYRLWDHKQNMRRVLLAVFVACMTCSLVLSVMMVLSLMRAQVVLPPRVIVCAVPQVPKDTPFLLGVLLLFNIFVISVSFYNALEEPRRRESEVFIALRRDGAKVYFIVSLLWVLLLVTSVFAEMLVYFPVLILAWSVGATLTSRMHLRIESLGLFPAAHPTMIYPTPDSED
ncbi:hypothetical protein EDD18DRAFT_1409436 [Armillaria luteobubalina]|uniref:DUF6533 domain-containing protein n=1 Tax=Armillaria luteobubalina TaxID=153913 RepID=A0AA39PY55_9AGAR|nr:hypothetical protein EDD18DRAFT_1409436 [Armillaria luteobubalina]